MTTSIQSRIIPKSFRLGGFKVDVQLDDTLAERKKVFSQSRYDANVIKLDPGAGSMHIVEQRYLAVLVAWIFYMMGEDTLCNNKRISEVFAHFLYQSLLTARPLHSPEPDASTAEHCDYSNELSYLPEDNNAEVNHDWSYYIRVKWWGEAYSEDDYSEGDYDEIGYCDYEDNWNGSDEDWGDSQTEDASPRRGSFTFRYYPELLPRQEDDLNKPLQLIARSLKFVDPVSGRTMAFESERSLLIT